ncbi:MAG: PulJ/GspJ family protein [Fervidobacterium sp.]|uniref:PulJ/GspJ family protein n=1 Tax=Fervidobacterium sp. TaxID=1871331 RepID=UPI0040498BE9
MSHNAPVTIYRDGFSLTETVVSLLLISIVFMIIAMGLSLAIQSLAVLQNFQKVTEFENFIARYVYVSGSTEQTSPGSGQSGIDINQINSAFYSNPQAGSQVGYPRITQVTVSRVTDASGREIFVKYMFRIERAPGKEKNFTAYQYVQY